ncbi:MAG: DNA primase [Acidimicrobiia bacterium]|nr:DNA primase [Acidimicrobiia bacterium]
MGIVDEDVQRVRDESDIVQVVSGYTQLKRVGTRFTGLCPFHSERSGSFSVNAERNLYYCFGCHAKGDVITFVREKEGLDFVEAIEWLANKSGIQLRYTDANQGKDRKRREDLQQLIRTAAEWYHDLLLKSPAAAPARGYLRERGYTGDIVREFQMGWAPDDWDQLARHLKASNKDFVDSGLGLINRRNKQQDWFRARVLFPIKDVRGHHIGFGGRVLPGSEGAKYMNSKDSLVYNKSSVLYGLDRAKGNIVAADEVVICEGYTDVIGYHIAGVPRAVATCGTALTERHVKELKKYCNRVVLSFDGDSAGQNAAARFYEWEKQYDLDVRVVDLPMGADPGDLAFSDPERLAVAVSEARPFLEFRINRVLRGADMDTVEGRARAAEEAISVVKEHPDPLVRDAYALQIADHTQMAIETIRSMFTAPRPGRSRSAGNRRGSHTNRRWDDNRGHGGPPEHGTLYDGPPPDQYIDLRDDPGYRGSPPGRQPRRPERYPAVELLAIRLVIQDPAAISSLVLADVFTSKRLGELFALLVEAGDFDAVVNKVDSDDQSLLYRLGVEPADADPLDVACQLWRLLIERERTARLRSFDPTSVEDQTALTSELRWFQEMLEALTSEHSQELTVSQLLAWMGTGSEEVIP